MKITLEELVDFDWIKKENAYGFVHTLPQLKNGTILRRIHQPIRNDIVLIKKENKLVPVIVLDGQYEVNGRISNYWYWKEINDDLTSGKKDSGYGGFYKPHVEFQLEQTFKITV